MKTPLKTVLLSQFIFASSLFSSLQAAPLYITTEDLAPRNFVKDGQMMGVATDQVNEMMKRAGQEYKIETMAWTRAISLAESEENTCAFSTLHTDARSPKFKWVEPLDHENIILFRKKGGTVSPKNEEDVKQLTIGVQSKGATYDVAVKHGFPKLEQVATYDMMVNKIINDRNDLGLASKSSVASYLQKGEIEEVMVVEAMPVGLACSKSTPDDVIQKLNAVLGDLIKDGTQGKIKDTYVSKVAN